MSQLGNSYGQVQAEVSSITGSTGSSVLCYSDDNRLRVTFFNHSSAALFLKFGDGASLTDFSVKLGSGSYYETVVPVHTGSITGIWDAAAGSVKITKYGVG